MMVRIMKSMLWVVAAVLLLSLVCFGAASADGGDSEYQLWLGATPVTSANKDDILGDGGKATYNPESCTLMLNNPVIEGVHTEGSASYKIYAGNNDFLKVTGTYHMPSADAEYGFGSETVDIIFRADLSFSGTESGVYAPHSKVTIDSNNLILTGLNDTGLVCKEMTFDTSMKLTDLSGGQSALRAEKIDLRWLSIRIPNGGQFRDNEIYETDGTTVAKHATISSANTILLWVGGILVTNRNRDDVLNDGGSVKYIPTSETLTLNDPVLEGVFQEGSASYKIYASGSTLKFTIKGSYHMEEADAQYGFGGDGHVNFDGHFTFSGTETGVHSSSIYVLSGCLMAKGDTGYGVSCGSITLREAVERAELQGATSALQSIELNNYISIIEPEGGQYKDGTIMEADGTTAAKRTMFSKVYDLWVGDVHVGAYNKDDILSDGGKAKYNPDTNTLTLNNPAIPGMHSADYFEYVNNHQYISKTCKICRKKGDLILKGTYHMSDNDVFSGVYVEGGSLTLDGDFSFYTGDWFSANAVYTSMDLHVLSGTLRAEASGMYSKGIYCGGTFDIQSGVTRIWMGGDIACRAQGGFSLAENLSITSPQNGTADEQYILNASGGGVSQAVIQNPQGSHFEAYEIWLGPTQVTSENKDDILGDGKARYEPSSGVLTLNDPVILGKKTHGAYVSKILICNSNVTIRGSYHMTDSATEVGLRTFCSALSLDGDFTFRGWREGIQISVPTARTMVQGNILSQGSKIGFWVDDGDGVTILSGRFTALSDETGYCGAGTLTICGDAESVICEGNTAALRADVLIVSNAEGQNIQLNEPEGAFFSPTNHGVIVGSEFAKRAAFFHQYSLWLGSTQVTSLNQNDILGDGLASYTPSNHTLTLNNPVIEDVCLLASTSDARIYAKDIPLTVRGSYHMVQSIPGCGIQVQNGSLTLDGDFTFLSSAKYGIYGNNSDVTVKSGTAKAVGDVIGLSANSFTALDGNSRIELQGRLSGLNAEQGFTLEGAMSVVSPDSGVYQNGRIYEADGVTEAKRVIIKPVTYKLWVGGVQVNIGNRNDILGDGTASFDVLTNTLYLNNPVINKNGINDDYFEAIIIARDFDLTVEGSLQTERISAYGVHITNGSLTLSGNLSFQGNLYGILMDDDRDLIIRSGAVRAYGRDDGGILGGRLKMQSGYEETVLEVQCRDYVALRCKSVKPGSVIQVVAPEGGYIRNEWRVENADGSVPGYVKLIMPPVGTQANYPFEIGSTADWEKLSAYLASGGNGGDMYVKQTADIAVDTMLVPAGTRFQGVYDGDGHTLIVQNTSASGAAAAIGSITNATIRNLKVTGSVTGANHSAGLVSGAAGENLIENCLVGVRVTTTGDYAGGVLGHGGSSATTLRGCVFSGNIAGATHAGTFWGWSDNGSSPVLEDCLDISDSSYPIGLGYPSPADSVSNTYYLNADKEKGTSRVWTNRGKIARAVTAGKDVTLDYGAGVQYKASGLTAYGTGLFREGILYASEGETVTIPSISSALTDRFSPDAGVLARAEEDAPWTLSMPAGNVVIYARVTPDCFHKGEGTAQAPYQMQNADQWERLAQQFMDTDHILDTEGVYFSLTADISTGRMLGTEKNPFQGVFNGGGHTLTFSDSEAPNDCAPFRYIRGAAIRNLHITGAVTTANRWAAGLVANLYGNCAISNCRSSVEIQSSHSGDGTHAGFVSVMATGSTASITGCVFDGAIYGDTTTLCAGLVGYARGSLYIRDCLVAPSAFEPSSSQNFSRWASGSSLIIENSYYLGPGVNNQGMRGYAVTAEGVTLVFGNTFHDVSGISAGSTGLFLDGVIYAGAGETAEFTTSGGPSDLIIADAGSLARRNAGWSLTMPEGNVTILSVAPFGAADFSLPTGLSEIEEEAFAGLPMTGVYLPDDCKVIGNRAFMDCFRLGKIRIPKECQLGNDIFDGCELVYVYSESGSYAEAYCSSSGHENCRFVSVQ